MEKLHGDNKKNTTVQDLIDLLQQVEDKTRIVNVWDRFGYTGSAIEIDYRGCLGTGILLESMED